MDVFEIVYIITTSLAILAMAAFNRMRDKDFQEEQALNNRRYDATSKALTNEALRLARIAERVEKLELDLKNLREKIAELERMAERVGKLESGLKELDAKVAELPVDEMTEEVQRMSAWNDGFSEIVGFGKNLPKLNKEVLKHE